ncbi:MAG: hypothetical protein FWD71_04545 [Oscillospiraceae bacterium]|nr:hypothetical protein [Oscillospiraceae bacterium]
MKKSILLLLDCVVLLSLLSICLLLFSCSQKSGETDTTTAAGSEASGSEQDSATNPLSISDNLPLDLDFNGATIRVWGREVDNVFYTSNWEFTEEMTGEIFNDALYARELAVEDRLNVNIEKTLTTTSFDNAYKAVKAGDDSFDILFANAYDVAPQALEGIYVNLADFPHIDYNMPWWPDTIMKDVTINGKTYFVTGDITPSVLGFMNCIFFNKKLAADYDISGLYDLVFSGKWTFDKYAEAAKNMYKDLNGNGVVDSEDMFGVTTSDYYDVYFSAFEIPITTTSPDGSLNLALGEKFYEAYSKLREFSMDKSALPQDISNKGETVNYENDVKFFANGQILFFGGLVRFSDYFRAMKDDYGILTVPKWDENQAEYHTTSHANYSLVSVPVTVPSERYGMIGAVMEAMASEGYRTTTPAYFNSTLKDKYSRDEETLKVLDILRNGLEFQPVMIYYKSMGDILHLFRYSCYPQAQYNNMVSYYEKNLPVFQKAIDKFNKSFLQ